VAAAASAPTDGSRRELKTAALPTVMPMSGRELPLGATVLGDRQQGPSASQSLIACAKVVAAAFVTKQSSVRRAAREDLARTSVLVLQETVWLAAAGCRAGIEADTPPAAPDNCRWVSGVAAESPE